MKKARVIKVELKNEDVYFTVVLPKSALIEASWRGTHYESERAVKIEIEKMLVKEIFDKHGKEIVEKVLKEVNWPEIVRSKIAVKVIQEAGKERIDY